MVIFSLSPYVEVFSAHCHLLFQAAREAVDEGKSVVIDNTNPGAAARADFIAIAEEQGRND